MVNLLAARRHHRSCFGYALGLLALLGTATALTLVAHPVSSATEQVGEPVPAPEITVAGQGTAPPDEPGEGSGWADNSDPFDAGVGAPPASDESEGGAGEEEPTGMDGARSTEDVSRALFYSGLLGLAISLAGLGLVGTRRRQW